MIVAKELGDESLTTGCNSRFVVRQVSREYEAEREKK